MVVESNSDNDFYNSELSNLSFKTFITDLDLKSPKDPIYKRFIFQFWRKSVVKLIL